MESRGSRPRDELLQGLLAPVYRLRAEYREAIAAMERVAALLGQIEGELGTGNRPQAPRPIEPITHPGTAWAPAIVPQPPRGPAGATSPDPQSADFASLLEFQEQLSRLSGVTRVTVTHLTRESATLFVELDSRPRG
jgi:hypothetical protein